MKKILFAVLCAGAIIGCSKEEVVSTNYDVITFDNAFIDNATKAAYDGSYDNSKLSEFQVYATITGEEGNTANIFNGERVVKGNELGQGANWSYAVGNTQYWIPGNSYTFRAIADGNVEGVSSVTVDANKLASEINLLNASAQKDILFAEENVAYESGAQVVKFTFAHLLAKAKFTVKNTIVTDNGYSYKVYGLSVNGIARDAVYNIANATWTAGTTEYDLAFGDGVATGTETGLAAENIPYAGQVESNYDRLLIPTDNEQLNITFTYELLKDGIVIDTQNKTIDTPALSLVSGQAYNFVISLGNPGEPIQFDVEKINDWDESAVALNPIEVASAAELLAAINNGENVVLTQDIDLDALTKAAAVGLVLNKDVIIDGNNHTVTTTAVRAFQIIDAKNVTIKNLNLVSTGERGFQIQSEDQTLVLENVNAVSANYTVHITSSTKNAKVTINNCDLKGLNTVNVWGENARVDINQTILRTEDNAKSEGYAVIYNASTNGLVTVNGGEIVITGTANDTYSGLVTTDSKIIFNETKGAGEVYGHNFAINYGEYRYTFATFAEAYEKAVAGETIVFLQDVTVESPLDIKKSLTLDLNGHTLTAAKAGAEVDAIWVRGTDNANVVITGNGTVNASFDCVYVAGNAKVTIENGTYNAVMETVYAAKDAQVVINGGTFKVDGSNNPDGDYGQVYTLNLKGGSNASITVYGGSFYNFNPAESLSENPQANFVAEGKTVEQNGDWYIVK